MDIHGRNKVIVTFIVALLGEICLTSKEIATQTNKHNRH